MSETCPAPVTHAQAAYEAYSSAIPEDLFPAHLRRMPWTPWEKLPPGEQQAYEAAAQAVLNQAFPGLKHQRDEARAVAGEFRSQLETAVREGDEARAELEQFRSAHALRGNTVEGLHEHLRTVTAERDEARAQLAAVRYFAATWAELLTALPDDYDCTMNCAEANAAADLYRALGDKNTAASIITQHARYDTDCDQHYAAPEDS